MNEFLKQYWKEILMVFLSTLIFFFYYQWDKTKKEWQADINSRKAGETSATINKPSEEVTKRENEVYPKIDKSINELNKSVKILNDRIAKEEKNKPTREQSYAIFKNQSTSEINRYFNSIGIPSTKYNISN